MGSHSPFPKGNYKIGWFDIENRKGAEAATFDDLDSARHHLRDRGFVWIAGNADKGETERWRKIAAAGVATPTATVIRESLGVALGEALQGQDGNSMLPAGMAVSCWRKGGK